MTDKDSGVRFIGITGPDGAKPVLHGGVPIALHEESSGIWTADTGNTNVYLDLTLNGERVLPALPGDLKFDKPMDWKIGGQAWILDENGDQTTGRKDAISIPSDDATDIQLGDSLQVFRHNWRWNDDVLTVSDIIPDAFSENGVTYTYVVLKNTDQIVSNNTPKSDEFFYETKDGIVYRPLAKPEFVGDGTGVSSTPEFGWESGELKLSTAESPVDGDVVAAQRYSIVTLNGADDVVLQGLVFADTLTPLVRAGQDFTGAARYDSGDWLNQAAVSIDNSDNTIISESTFKNVGRAINLHDSSATRILDNDLLDLGRDGIVVRGDSDGTLIAGNTIDDIGEIIAGSVGADLLSPGEVDHTTIIHNTITDSAGRGITTGNEKTDAAIYGTRILDNQFGNLLLQTGDGGAIHLYSRSVADSGTLIQGNIIQGVKGIILNKDQTAFVPGLGDGIYLDVRTNDVLVTDNFIEDISSAAVHIHGGSGITIENNYALLDRTGGEDDWGGDKFLHAHEHVSTLPVGFWVPFTSTGAPHKVSLTFDNVHNDTVYLQSLDVNGKEFTAPGAPRDYEPIEITTNISPDNPIYFGSKAEDQPDNERTISDNYFTNDYLDSKNPHIDKVSGNYNTLNEEGYAYVVVRLAYVGDSDSPKFTLNIDDEIVPIVSPEILTKTLIDPDDSTTLKVPERTSVISDISLARNVISYDEPSSSQDPVKSDYIRFFPMWPNVEIQEGTITSNYNVLYNTERYVDRDFIQAEDYTAASDTSAGNSGGVYRDDDVDIEETSDSGGGYNVGWIEKGEWLEYIVAIPQDGEYTFFVRAASPNIENELNAKLVRLYDDEHPYEQTVNVDFFSTGGLQAWGTFHGQTPFTELTQGTYKLTVTAASSGFNINYFDFNPDADTQWLADDFREDDNSNIATVKPLIPDDSTRGYGLHPEIAREAQALGIEDPGSNGLDLWSTAGTDGFDWQTFGDGFDGTPAPRGTPAGYTWKPDQSQHVVYRDSEDHIQELYYKKDDSTWHRNDLTDNTGAPLAAGSPAGYTWESDAGQHVVYRDYEGRIQELFYQASQGIWLKNDLTAETGAELEATGVPAGYTWDVDNSQHVIYRDIDGHIQQLYYSEDADAVWRWHLQDVTTETGALLAASSPTAYTWDADDSQHIVYRDVDGHIQELYFQKANLSWHDNDLTPDIGTKTLDFYMSYVGSPVGWNIPNGYGGLDWDQTGSRLAITPPESDRPMRAEVPIGYLNATVSSSGFAEFRAGGWISGDGFELDSGYFTARGAQPGKSQESVELTVRGVRDGETVAEDHFTITPYETAFHEFDGFTDLDQVIFTRDVFIDDLTINIPSATGTPAGYVWDVDDSQHVVYRDANGRIQELYYQDAMGVWLGNDLTTAANNAPRAAGSPVGYTWDADASQHVVYRDGDGQIQELFYQADVGGWLNNNLTASSGNPSPAVGDPSGYVWDVPLYDWNVDHSQHVVYPSKAGHIQELYSLEVGTWDDNDLGISSSVIRPSVVLGTDSGEIFQSTPGNDIVLAGGGIDYWVGSTDYFERDYFRGGLGADEIVADNYWFGGYPRPPSYGDGRGRDIIAYEDVSESSNQYGVDLIDGFRHGQDKIDLSLIDPFPSIPGDQLFEWGGQLTESMDPRAIGRIWVYDGPQFPDPKYPNATPLDITFLEGWTENGGEFQVRIFDYARKASEFTTDDFVL